MSALGSLIVKLALEYAEYTQGLDKSEQQALQFAKRIQGHFDTAASAIKGLFSGLAAGVSVGALLSVVNASADAADSLAKLSQRTGETVENLSKLQYAASLNDVSNEQLTAGLDKLSKAMGDVVAGTGESRMAFDALGLTHDIQAGRFKTSSELFSVIADRMASYEDGANKAAVAQKIFGESGALLIPLLNNGSEGLKRLGGEAERLGFVMSGDLAASAEQYNDALTRVSQGTSALAREVSGPIIVSLGNLIARFFEAKSAGLDFIDSLSRAFGSQSLIQDLADKIERQAKITETARKLADANDYSSDGGFSIQRYETEQREFDRLIKLYTEAAKEITGMGVSASVAAPQMQALTTSASKASDASKAAAAAAKAAATEYDKISNEIAARIAVLNAEGVQTAKLTATQQAYLKLQADLTSGSSKLTAAKKAEVLGFAAAAVQIEANNIATDEARKLAEEYGRSVEAMLGPLEDRARAAERELATYGQAESRIERTAVARLEEARAIAAANGALPEHLRFLDREIEARTALMKTAAARELLEQQTEVWRSIDNVAHDTFVSIFDSGKNAFERLRDTLKNTLYDLLYQMTVRKWLIDISASISGTGVAGQAFGYAAQNSLGGGGSGTNFISTGGFSLGNSAGVAYANATGTGLDGLLSTNGAYGTAQVGGATYTGAGAAGNVAGGVGGGYYIGQQLTGNVAGGVAGAAAGYYAAMNIPYVGWVLAALAVLNEMGVFNTSGGTPHVGGAAFSDIGGGSGAATALDAPGFGLEWGAFRAGHGGDRSAVLDLAVGNVVASVADDLFNRAGRYGGDATGLRVTGKFASDGEDKSLGGYAVYRGTDVLYGNTSKYSKDAQKGFGEFGADSIRAEVAALQSLDLDKWFGRIFATVDPLTDSLEVLNQTFSAADEVLRQSAVMENIRALGIRDAAEDARVAGLSAAAAWFESSERIRSAAASGAYAVDELAQLASQHYANEVELLRNIDQVSRSAGQTFADSMRNIQYSVLNSEGKYDFLDKEAARFRDVLKSITDPHEIERYASKLNSTINTAFSLLDPAAQAKYADQFVERLQTADDLTQERLAAAREQVRAEQNSLATQLADAAAAGIGRAVDAMIDDIHAAIPKKLDVAVTVTQIPVSQPSNPFARVGVEIGDGG